MIVILVLAGLTLGLFAFLIGSALEEERRMRDEADHQDEL